MTSYKLAPEEDTRIVEAVVISSARDWFSSSVLSNLQQKQHATLLWNVSIVRCFDLKCIILWISWISKKRVFFKKVIFFVENLLVKELHDRLTNLKPKSVNFFVIRNSLKINTSCSLNGFKL